jgi:hypothetical protein
MKTLFISLLSCLLAACEFDDGGAVAPGDTDAELVVVPDAGPTPDRIPQIDASTCKTSTEGLIVGDELAMNMAAPGAAAPFDTVETIAFQGATVKAQLAAWMFSPRRGDPDLDWVYIQVGIYNVLRNEEYETIVQDIEALIERINYDNPSVVVILGDLWPARKYIDRHFPWTFATWADVNERLWEHGSTATVRYAMTEVGEYLKYDSGDGFHPTPEGYLVASTVLRGVIDEYCFEER